MAQPVIAAQVRERTGKGAARKIRKSGQIPGVFYGPSSGPVLLTVDYPAMERILKQASSENIILDLQLQGSGSTETKKAILKELQVDPVKDTYMHVDFYEISMDRKITVDVAVHLINTPVGVTEGGILEQIRRELTIYCLPDQIMDSIEVDVSQLNIGDAVHVEDIQFPEGVECEEDDHLTLAVVSAPRVEEVPEEEIEEELGEGEVPVGEAAEAADTEDESNAE
jgi:large subunit ribosomal protein L25